VLVLLRFYMIARRRRQLEEQGYTLEEWKLIESEKAKAEENKGAP